MKKTLYRIASVKGVILRGTTFVSHSKHFHLSDRKRYPLTGISRENLPAVVAMPFGSPVPKLPSLLPDRIFFQPMEHPLWCRNKQVLLFVTTFFKTYYIYLSRVPEDCQVDSRSSLYLHIKISPIISIVKIFISAYNTWEHLIIGVPQKFVILLTENTFVL